MPHSKPTPLAKISSMSENNRHTGDFMKIETLRKNAGREEIDYPFLLSELKEYSRPRDKITEWLKSGDLIRVKKGLYVFGKNSAQLKKSNSANWLSSFQVSPYLISTSF